LVLLTKSTRDQLQQEVDMILIQCDRLNWSPSVSRKSPSGEHGGAYQSYTGSKRNYDFNYDRRGVGVNDDCEWSREGAVVSSRPSLCR
jgi:hypothetical protein